MQEKKKTLVGLKQNSQRTLSSGGADGALHANITNVALDACWGVLELEEENKWWEKKQKKNKTASWTHPCRQ